MNIMEVYNNNYNCYKFEMKSFIYLLYDKLNHQNYQNVAII